MKTTEYSVLSLNMFGTPFHPKKILRTFFRNDVRKRFRAIARVIEASNIDILMLQEVHDFPHYYFLKKLLPQYKYISYKKMLYGPRGGLVIFSKYPLERAHYYDFIDKGSFYNKSITGYISVKGFLSVRVQATNIWIINTHLTQNSDHDFSESNRYAGLLKSQLKQIIVHLHSLQNKNDRVILGGDFNMPKDTKFYNNFISESKLVDAFAQDSFTTYHKSFLPEGASVGRVDYIFSSPSLHPIRTEYILKTSLKDNDGIDFYASDHIGLVVAYLSA